MDNWLTYLPLLNLLAIVIVIPLFHWIFAVEKRLSRIETDNGDGKLNQLGFTMVQTLMIRNLSVIM